MTKTQIDLVRDELVALGEEMKEACDKAGGWNTLFPPEDLMITDGDGPSRLIANLYCAQLQGGAIRGALTFRLILAYMILLGMRAQRRLTEIESLEKLASTVPEEKAA